MILEMTFNTKNFMINNNMKIIFFNNKTVLIKIINNISYRLLKIDNKKYKNKNILIFNIISFKINKI